MTDAPHCAETAQPIFGGFIDPQAPLERRIRELEEQVATLEAARMPHVPDGIDPVIRALVSERLRRGMSQRDVVHAVGCSSASVSQWERGISSPTLAKLRAWAEALDMDLNVNLGIASPTANERPECVRTASCEPGDHTYSWPCVHAVTPTERGI